jgi:hypothetical protein
MDIVQGKDCTGISIYTVDWKVALAAMFITGFCLFIGVFFTLLPPNLSISPVFYLTLFFMLLSCILANFSRKSISLCNTTQVITVSTTGVMRRHRQSIDCANITSCFIYAQTHFDAPVLTLYEQEGGMVFFDPNSKREKLPAVEAIINDWLMLHDKEGRALLLDALPGKGIPANALFKFRQPLLTKVPLSCAA